MKFLTASASAEINAAGSRNMGFFFMSALGSIFVKMLLDGDIFRSVYFVRFTQKVDYKYRCLFAGHF